MDNQRGDSDAGPSTSAFQRHNAWAPSTHSAAIAINANPVRAGGARNNSYEDVEENSDDDDEDDGRHEEVIVELPLAPPPRW